MKSALPYLIIFGVTLALAGLTIAAVYHFRPDLFATGGVGAAPTPSAPATPVPTDSSTHAGQVQPADTAGRSSPPPPSDRVEPPAAPAIDGGTDVRDSLRLLAAELQEERAQRQRIERSPAAPGEPLPASEPLSRADSIRNAELRTMAKVMESMEPESAAKILRDLPDRDVKAIVFGVKTRQAAKILSAIEPERAARLIK